MLLSAYCLLPTDCQRRDILGEVGILFDGLVETLSGSLSFGGDSSLGLGICPGLAVGLQGTIGTLPSFIDRCHPHHVDVLLSWRAE